MSFLENKEPSLFQRRQEQKEIRHQQEQKQGMLGEFAEALKKLAEDKNMPLGQQGMLIEVLGYLTDELALADLRDNPEVRKDMVGVLGRAEELIKNNLTLADSQMREIGSRLEQPSLIEGGLTEELRVVGAQRDFLIGLRNTLQTFKSFLQRF